MGELACTLVIHLTSFLVGSIPHQCSCYSLSKSLFFFPCSLLFLLLSLSVYSHCYTKGLCFPYISRSVVCMHMSFLAKAPLSLARATISSLATPLEPAAGRTPSSNRQNVTWVEVCS